jgi:hypothetical protein
MSRAPFRELPLEPHYMRMLEEGRNVLREGRLDTLSSLTPCTFEGRRSSRERPALRASYEAYLRTCRPEGAVHLRPVERRQADAKIRHPSSTLIHQHGSGWRGSSVQG